MIAMDVTGLRAMQTATAQADALDDLLLALAAVQEPLREALYSTLTRPGPSNVRQAVAGIDASDRQAAERAAEHILQLTEPDALLLPRAQVLHYRKEYARAAEAYEQAVAAGCGGESEIYSAACCRALAGEADSAFRLLDGLAAGGWSTSELLRDDEELASLHCDARWEPLLRRIDAGQAEREAALPEVHTPLRVVKLPEPAKTGSVTVEAALWQRRSVRAFAGEPLTLEAVSQVLWSAYGVTQPTPNMPQLRGGFKTAPSAGGCYPLEVYLFAGNVAGLDPGVYRYRCESHELELLAVGDRRAELAEAAFGQNFVRAPAALVWSAVFERTTRRYGARGRERYVAMDLGHSGENVCLQCVALGLGSVAVGAFNDSAVKRATNMTRAEEPLYIIPFGRPKSGRSR
jgi:SagB-type dehydrogenase family enzyme